MSLGELVIGLQANTAQFQSDIGKTVNIIQNFAAKTGDVSKAVDRAFSDLTRTGKNTANELQKSFNALNIRSDFTMEVQQQALLKAKDFFLRQFVEIGKAANTTANDVKRAFTALNLTEAKLEAQTLKAEFASLGIQSEASIIAAKKGIIAAFEEIQRTGTKYPQDIVRAHEAMVAELKRLDDMLVTQAERDAAKKREVDEKLVADRIRLDNERRAAAERNMAQEIAAFKRMKADEMASYAAHGMTGSGAAARLIGQQHAGSDFAKRLRAQMEEVSPAIEKATQKMNLFGLASVAAILKIQILYSTVNTLMSAIGKLPSVAVDAIETFNSSIVKNAAVITSMTVGARDIGQAYRENRAYAEAVQNVLVKMDAQTIASYKQLQLMNEAFVNQGVFIDINNKKQLEGYKNIANALATISAGMQNPDLQFSQEIRGLMNAEDKPTNMLFRQLKAIDPLLKEHLEQWKKIGQETGNAGYILEKLGPLLVGYAAASGDIESLWATVKSTMATIRDEVLRGGLSQGFAEIVKWMKEITKSAQDNKEKVQAFLKDSMDRAIGFAKGLSKIVEISYQIAEPAMWTLIVVGINSAVGAMSKLVAEFTLATGGMNLLIAGATTLGLIGAKKILSISEQNAEVANIQKLMSRPSSGLGANAPAFGRDQYNYIKEQFPLITNEQIVSAMKRGSISLRNPNEWDVNFLGNNYQPYAASAGVVVDRKRLAEQLAYTSPVKVPKATKLPANTEAAKVTESFSDFNSFVQAYRTEVNNTELESYQKSLGRINDRFSDLLVKYEQLNDKDKKEFFKQTGIDALAFRNRLDELKDGVVGVLQASEINKAETFFDQLERFSNKGEETTLKKQLADIDTQTSILIDKFESLNDLQKVFLDSRGINIDKIQSYGEQAKQVLIDKDKLKTVSETVQIQNETKSIKDQTLGLWEEPDPLKELTNKKVADEALINAELEKMEKMGELNDEQVDKYNAYIDKMMAIDEKYTADKKRLDKTHWESAASSLADSVGKIGNTLMQGNKKQFELGKKLALASIAIDTNMGAMKAFTSVAGIPFVGPALGMAAMGAVLIQGIAAAAKVSSTTYEGRALGGPVQAGQTYIVNENRSTQGPEYFTPGVNGVITPANKVGNGGVEVTQVFQISTGVAETVSAEIRRIAPSLVQLSVNAVRSAMRQGEFQGA